ncbi:MAG: DUF975 family protein [Lachnospiraceae bacterium]|nr:DUF975 family protein [Lachnospiraceae bacterium]
MAAFKANYWKCVLVAFILALISGGLSSGSSYRSGGNFSEMINNFTEGRDSGKENIKDLEDEIGSGILDEIEGEKKEEKTSGFNAPPIGVIVMVIVAVFIVCVIAMVIGFVISAFLLNPIEVGCDRFFVANLDEPAELSNLSRGFEGNYKNVVKIMFYKDLYLFLWFLIPIAGFFIMIYKCFEYMMIPYIVADDPDIDKDEAFALSKEMMDGQKWDAFVLGLSFIGWHLLGVLTIGILELFYVAPYVQSTYAALYETLSSGYTDNDIVDNNSGYIEGAYRNA